MKQYKTKVIREQRIELVICDGCGKKTHDTWEEPQGFDEGGDFGCDIELKCALRWSISEGGSGVEYEYDICPQCFLDKIKPLFPKIKAREYDY